MTWERIAYRSTSVSVAWRKPGGRGVKHQLGVNIPGAVAQAMGLERGMRVMPERNIETGRLRLTITQDRLGRLPNWKRSKNSDCCMVFVPLVDVSLPKSKPAQAVPCDIEAGALTLKLPPWAIAPKFVRVTSLAIPLKEGRAA